MATTADSSIGQAIDKAAKMLKLNWVGGSPGGALETYAARYEVHTNGVCDERNTLVKDYFTLPMPGQLQFSYSCLDTQLRRLLQKRYGIDLAAPGCKAPIPAETLDFDEQAQCLVASTFQIAVFNQLESKIAMALKRNSATGVEQLVVSGGVASNLCLRERFVCFGS